MIPRIEAAIDAGRFVPLIVADATGSVHPNAGAFMAGLLIGRTRDEVAALEEQPFLT